jgi:uncharacterized protein with HEPN domain
MRDVLVHEYWGIDLNVVWATVQVGIPPLKTTILEILRGASIGDLSQHQA